MIIVPLVIFERRVGAWRDDLSAEFPVEGENPTEAILLAQARAERINREYYEIDLARALR